MLKLENINKHYHNGSEFERHILKNINLEFSNTGLVVILGKSGCGKTTLLNVIGGILNYKGKITYDNNFVCKNNKGRKKDIYRKNNIGYIFQNYLILNEETVYNNLDNFLKLDNIDELDRKILIEKALKEVGLWQYKEKYAKYLSGGEQQKLGIARAIANNKKIILADEPTGNLDSKSSIQILELLKKISEKALVIMVTHNESLLKFADRKITMRDGFIYNDEVITVNNSNLSNEIIKSKNEIKREKISNLKWKTEYKKKNPLLYFSLFLIGVALGMLCLYLKINYSNEKNYNQYRGLNDEILFYDYNEYTGYRERSFTNNQILKLLKELSDDNLDTIIDKNVYLFDDLSFDLSNGIRNLYARQYLRDSSNTRYITDKIKNKIILGKNISNKNEILIDKMLADDLIKHIKEYNKSFSYQDLFMLSFSDSYGNYYNISGITDLKYYGVFCDKELFFELMTGKTEDLNSLKIIRDYENTDLELIKKTDRNNELINVYASSNIKTISNNYKIIGEIKNTIDAIIFENDEDYQNYLRKYKSYLNSNYEIFFKSDFENLELVNKTDFISRYPTDFNEILIPDYYIDYEIKFLEEFKIKDHEIVGYYKTDYIPLTVNYNYQFIGYVTTRNLIYENYRGNDTNYSISIISNNLDNIKSELRDLGYNPMNYQELIKNIDENGNNINSNTKVIIFIIILFVMIFILFYFLMKSKINSEIYYIAVYRTLGCSKINIILRYLKIASLISLTTVIFGYTFITVIFKIVLKNDELIMKFFEYLFGASVIYLVNILISFIPALFLLIKEPAKIIQKYDL